MITARNSLESRSRGQFLLAFLQKASFVSLLTYLIFLISASPASAEWAYDKDQPNSSGDIFIQVDCGNNGSYDDPEDLEAFAEGGNMGTCNADSARVRFSCKDYPTVGGTGCRGYEATAGNFSQLEGEEVWDEDSGISSPVYDIIDFPGNGLITVDETVNNIFTISELRLIDWAGNSYAMEADAYFNFTYCSLSLTNNISVFEGSTGTAIATIVEGTVDSVNFSSSDTGVFTVDPASDDATAYQTTITGVQDGTGTLTANGIINGSVRCTDTETVTISQVVPWWQVKDGDVHSNGVLRSVVPNTCAQNGLCSPYFNLRGAGGYPGIVSYVTSVDFGQATSVSEEGWIVKSPGVISLNNYKYLYFKEIVPDAVFSDSSAVLSSDTVNQATLLSGYQSNGAYYHSRVGNLTVSGDVNVGSQKSVLFVEGNVDIDGKINLTDGEGFFAIFATGTITVDGAVTDGNNPALEGFFLTNGTFDTSDSTNKLVIRGSVAGFGGIDLNRNLEGGNDSSPSEVIEYAPDLIFTMPKDLLRYNPQWEEIAF